MSFFTTITIIICAFSIGSTSEQCLNFKEFLEEHAVRPVALDVETNLCHWAFTNGPCNPGEWFRFGDGAKGGETTRPGYCEERACQENSEADLSAEYPRFWFEHEGKCLLTDVENIEFCGQNDLKVYFTEEDDSPTCLDAQPLVLSNRGMFKGFFKRMKGF
ncbi:DNA-directed RNA polymerase subunit beta [Orchesella cincta]|uniref:DNA-directed RNA polymerase subunit beta n=1 Tax=Orchesella cincta TaxID=48709 RepID=A0A1D2N321_ORCCI|nr:DNA-directed RNA polymerase subunit beta [Orchesella cincta]